MKAMLAVAATAILAASPAARAETFIVDFEEFDVGDTFTGNGDYTWTYFFGGTIVDLGGNKVLAAPDQGIQIGAGHHLPNPVPGGPPLEEKIVGTFDVLSLSGGRFLDNGAPQELPPGVWVTLDFRGAYGGHPYSLRGAGPFYLDNIAYESVLTGVPEPTSWVLMIFGFGAMGSAMRSQRRRSHLRAHA